MKRFIFPLATCVLTANIFAQDLPPIPADAILQELDAFEQTQKQAQQRKLADIAAEFQKASTGSSVTSLFEQAVAETKFRGKASGGTEMAEWRKQNGEFVRTREVQTALKYYAKYVTLLLQAQAMGDQEATANASWNYVKELTADSAVVPSSTLPKGPQEIVKESLEGAVDQATIGKQFSLGQYLGEAKKLELVPGNFEGILDKNVRPILRERKIPVLIETWDLQLQVEQNRANRAKLDLATNRFETLRRQQLLFNRAKDLAAIGYPNRAITEIVTLIRQNPQHPDSGKWIAEVRTLIKSNAAPAATGEPTTNS